MKGYIIVEGHGEVEAAQNLVTRLSHDHGLYEPWSTPRRWNKLHTEEGVLKALNFARYKSDAARLLILRDEDDGCPKDIAPKMASLIAAQQLPFDVAYVLLNPEYEVLFLPCLHLMTQHGFREDIRWDAASWESRRGIKEWLTRQMPSDLAYKPTTLQKKLTSLLDFDILRRADVPCFGSLERAIRFFSQPAEHARVYPATARARS